MSARRLLIVATAPVSRETLREQVPELRDPGETAVRVVAPASRLSRLQWLASDEDEARSTAEETAERAVEAAEDQAGVEAEVGDSDPLRAAEDALRLFRADELLVVVPPEEEASWLERASLHDGFEQFGLPVRYLVTAGRDPEDG